MNKNNILFLSDIHFQFINRKNILQNNELLKFKIYQALDFWLIKNSTNNIIDLYITWDFFNYVKSGSYREKINRKNNIVALWFYFSVIKDYIELNWYMLDKMFYVKWNHDYYNNYPKKDFNFFEKENIVDTIIKDEFLKIFWWEIEIINLYKNPYTIWDNLIIWNMLYSSWMKYDELSNWWVALNLIWSNIYTQLNDCNEFEKIIMRWIYSYIKETPIRKLFDINFYLSLDEKNKKLFNVFKKDYEEFIIDWVQSYKDNFAKISKFIFLYFYLTLLQDIYKSSKRNNNIKEIDILTHYPFELLWNKMLYILNDVEIEEIANNNKNSENKNIDNCFYIDNSFLIELLEYISIIIPSVQVINLFCWHTHKRVKINSLVENMYFGNIRSINLYNNSIGKIN